MAQKCTVFGMLLTIHSLGLIFASLFIHKWYTDTNKDEGIFGICRNVVVYFNQTHQLFGNSHKFFECYQLLWPDSTYAEQYLAEKPVYLYGIMGVGIASAALGFLTLTWSLFCILLPHVGYHPRSCDLLLALSILTDLAVITTIGMFLGKDLKIYPFENYGVSFWLNVGAAGGFLVISVVFAVNRINSDSSNTHTRTIIYYLPKYYSSQTISRLNQIASNDSTQY